MKIDMDIDRLAASSVQQQTLNPELKNINAAAAPSGSSGTLQNLSKKRAFIDAIIIAQIAQSFFQKAILISSELKSIASEAIASGRIKETDLTGIFAGARSALNELQEAPGTAANLNYMTIYQHTGIKIDVPELAGDLDSLDSFAKELSAGEMPDLKSIDRIKERLINKESALNNYYDQLIGELHFPGRANPVGGALVADTISRIIDFPQVALNSQGNVSHEIAKTLL